MDWIFKISLLASNRIHVLNPSELMFCLTLMWRQESQKLALAESTGLDQKQINNWFINQRKRHWKPSEDMQFVVMDATHPHYYMDNVLGNPYPMDISPTLL